MQTKGDHFIEGFEMWCNRRIVKISWAEHQRKYINIDETE